MTVEDLCEKVARRHVLEQLYPEDDETAFHEISSSQFDSLVSSLNNLSTSQEALFLPITRDTACKYNRKF